MAQGDGLWWSGRDVHAGVHVCAHTANSRRYTAETQHCKDINVVQLPSYANSLRPHGPQHLYSN